MNQDNSHRTVWINTHRATLAEYEADMRYPLEDMRQGRDSRIPVPRFSMLAGKPSERQPRRDSDIRGLFWSAYIGAVLFCVVCVVAMSRCGVQP